MRLLFKARVRGNESTVLLGFERSDILEVYSYTEMDLQKFANQVKDLVIEELEKEKLISKSAEEIASSYCVCLTKKGLFGRFFDKVNHKDDDKEVRLIILKDNKV